MNSDNHINKLISENKFTAAANPGGIDAVVDFIRNIVIGKQLSSIYIVGGVASGKSFLANALAKKLGDTVIISTDDYVKGTREWRREEIVAKNKSPLLKYDFELLKNNVKELLTVDFKPVLLPRYHELTGLAIANTQDKYLKIETKPKHIIVEGDFYADIKPDLLVYLHASDDLRAHNRINRDTAQRNETDLEKLLKDIAIRDEQQHFPFTLPVAQQATILLKLEKTPEKKFLYTIYKKQ